MENVASTEFSSLNTARQASCISVLCPFSPEYSIWHQSGEKLGVSSEKLPRVIGLCYILVLYPSKILQCLIIKWFLSWDLEKQEVVSAVDAIETQLAERRCVWWLQVGQQGEWIAVTCVSTAFHHHLDFAPLLLSDPEKETKYRKR